VVLHTAALADPDACARDLDRAYAINAGGTAAVARAAAACGAALVYTSTDLVYPGDRGGYREDDPPRPLGSYAKSKLAGEWPVRDAGGCVARTALVYGRGRAHGRSFAEKWFDHLRAGNVLHAFVDQ